MAKISATQLAAYRLPCAVMGSARTLIDRFAEQLASLIEGQALDRARAIVESALRDDVGPRRPGRPSKILAVTVNKKPRKKAPIQLCPVPGCKNPAAPVYGMVCARHKDLPKAKIKAYREARRAKKLKHAAA